MNTRQQYDLIIVGAGPVGSAAALIASQHGLSTLLVDESREVFPLPRAIHFDADIMRILQFAGIAGEVEKIARATTGGVHLGIDGEPIREFRVPDEPGDLGWRPHYMFSQPQFDQLLRTAAAAADGVDVRLGYRCDGIDQRDDGSVAVRLSTTADDGNDGNDAAPADDADRELGPGATVTASFVIASDGAASTIRKALGITLDDYGFDEPWVIIDGQVDDPELGPDYTIMYCDPARPGTYVPGPGRHRRWEFMVLPGESGEELMTDIGARALIAPVTPWFDPDGFELQRVAKYRFHALVADQWRSGNVFLAGDAAHQTPPFYGQGMCHGIRDVRNLLWKISEVHQGRATDALLDTYQVEREPHVRAIIEAAVANGRYICTLDPAVAEERDRTLRARMNQGTDARSFRDVIPGLTSGLLDSDDTAEARGLLFAQPPVATPDGRRLPLDDLLGAGWALVALPEIDIEDSARGRQLSRCGIDTDLVDVTGTLREWFATFDCAAALIRPDRYVYGTATDDRELAALLSRFDTAQRHLGERDAQLEDAAR